MSRAEHAEAQRAKVAAAWERTGGNVSAISRELGITRATVSHHLAKLKKGKPLVGGSVNGVVLEKAVLPSPGQVKRYVLTSAQNNTRLHDRCWASLVALSEYYEAEILVGTYSYNKSAYGPLATKRGTASSDRTLWYDERLEPFVCDKRIELANGLLWCGEMNIQPTAVDPLEGLETYAGRKSAVFPHAKHSARSIAAFKGEATKFNYTTGTVTQRNYIQKKAGLKAEHHHGYGAVLVEVNSDGNWWVRQLDCDDKGRIQDLDLIADGAKVTYGNRVEAITWGDLHATTVDPTVLDLSTRDGGMLDSLRPKHQFIHDVMEGVGINHHNNKNCHEKFKSRLRGFDSVEAELSTTASIVGAYCRPWATTVVVSGNHDVDWLYRWLREHDYRQDPQNALLFLEMQLEVYRSLDQKKDFRIAEWSLRKFGCREEVKFLHEDESYKICGDRIECSMHGHRGPNGARGTPLNVNKVGRRATTGHTHSAGIYDGLYVAGTSTTLDMDYNKGPSSWSHTHVVTYPNGRRTLVTMFAGHWRA